MKKRIQSNSAFMGKTHLTSSLALYLGIMAFYPAFLYRQLGTKSIPLFIASCILVAGSSLWPDLDNTQSTAKNTLGIIGNLLSWFFRFSGVVIYKITRTKSEEKDPNPHRLFWHTILSALIIFFIVFTTTSIKKEVKIYKEVMSIGEIFFYFWIYICSTLAFSSILKKWYKKNKKDGFTGSLINMAISIFITIIISILSKDASNFRWAAFAIAFGYFLHILGDACTIQGVPLLFPFKIKGKRWYNINFFNIKAGGEIEDKILFPFFIILILIASSSIVYYSIN